MPGTRHAVPRPTAAATRRAGKEAELKAELEALIEPTSQEDGYVNYDLHQGVEDPSTFFFYENWESAAQLDELLHQGSPVTVRTLFRGCQVSS